MILEIPFYSQYDDVLDETWRSKACAVTCLKMALDFSSTNTPSIDELIKEGVSINGYTPHGWSHDVIVFLAHNHGVPAYREEFRSANTNFQKELENIGLQRIIMAVTKKRGVVASIIKPNDSYHTVLTVGFEGEEMNPTHIVYHDPDTKDGGSAFQKVSLQDFLEKWRKLAIFIG